MCVCMFVFWVEIEMKQPCLKTYFYFEAWAGHNYFKDKKVWTLQFTSPNKTNTKTWFK